MVPTLQSVRSVLVRAGFKPYNDKTKLGFTLIGPKRSEVKRGKPAVVIVSFGDAHTYDELLRGSMALRARFMVPQGVTTTQRTLRVYTLADPHGVDEFEGEFTD